jgi:hypothetical protein
MSQTLTHEPNEQRVAGRLSLKFVMFILAPYVLAACGADTSGSSVVTTDANGTVSNNDGGIVIAFPDALANPDGTAAIRLSVDPPSANLKITNRGTAATQSFTASVLQGNQQKVVEASWSIDRYEAGTISQEGAFSTKGFTGGTFIVTATFGGVTAKATVVVDVRLTDLVPGEKTPTVDQQIGLSAPTTAEPANTASQLRYPLADTVFPRGLTAPAIELTPGAKQPEAILVRIVGDGFAWEGSYIPDNATAPSLQIPQDIWDAALGSNARRTLKVEVIKLSGGKTYGPSTLTINVAPTTLRGAVYYMTYSAPTGLYSVRPGVKEPAKYIVKGCVVCHSVSANGQWLSAGAEVGGAANAMAGVYRVGPDGSATQTDKTPADFGGDTRGLSYAAWTPDGKFVVRSKNDFWGGPEQRAFSIDEKSGKLAEVTVEGIGKDTSTYVPSFSPDGNRFVFTTGDGNKNGTGTPRRSLAMMNVAAASDKLSFSNRKLLFDNGKDGDVPKFAIFLPDSRWVVFQEGNGYDKGFSEMLPSWTPKQDYSRSPTRLWAVDSNTGERVELKRANKGLDPLDEDRNYEPSALPVSAGGYYWVVFTSQREHGNRYKQANNTTRKELWVSAISPEWKAGEDPSHPPFLLPNQGDTHNERGYWALEPCRVESMSCESGDQCCEGFCRPADPTKPESPRMCQKPKQNVCAQEAEKCIVAADCCPDADRGGVRCLGGFCAFPAPPG